MGTRNLTLVIHKQKPVVAQYGQWDGYPEGQGLTVLRFLQKKENIEKLRNAISKLRYMQDKDTKERKDFCVSIGASGDYLGTDQGKQYDKQFPFDSRDHGADILNKIIESNLQEIVLNDAIDFGKETLFCEWAYKLNLDTETLFVYQGGTLGSPIKSYAFDNLPDEDTFLKELES